MSEITNKLEKLVRLPEFYHPIVSPVGNTVAFYWDKTGRNELYTLSSEDEGWTQISQGAVPRNARYPIVWGPYGNRILFHKDTKGNERTDIHSINLQGETNEIISNDGQNQIYDVEVSGHRILSGSTKGGQMNLYNYNLETNNESKLTNLDQPVQNAGYNPETEEIAFTSRSSPSSSISSVFLLPSDGEDIENVDVTGEANSTKFADWGPDGDRILIGDNTTDMPRCGVHDITTDETIWFGDATYEERPVAFLPDGDGILVRRFRNATITPVIYSGPDQDHELQITDGVSRIATGYNDVFLDSNHLIFGHTSPTQHKRLVSYNLETDAFDVLVENDDPVLTESSFVEPRYVTYESFDGLEIGAICYDSGVRPSPVVVVIHGGPHAQSLHEFDVQVQYLLEKGYSVVQPNYRGSIGRGREFRRAVQDDWGGAEQKDIAHAGRWLQSQSWVDSDRLAVFGGSFGGYSTYMQLINYPGLWKTGVSWAGVADLRQMLEETMPHFRAQLIEHLGDPEENAEFLRERSPIEHVEKLERPVLIIHGVNDPRCPISQTRTFRDALEDRGWTAGEEFEYIELDEGHGSTDSEQRVKVLRAIGEYFETNL